MRTMTRRSQYLLIVCLPLLLVAPALALVWSGVVQAQGVGGSWATRASMPTARYGLGLAAASNGKLYAVGGYDGSTSLTTVEEYDPASNSWVTRAAMPTAHCCFGFVAASNGKLYAVDSGSVEEYDPATNTWATRA